MLKLFDTLKLFKEGEKERIPVKTWLNSPLHFPYHKAAPDSCQKSWLQHPEFGEDCSLLFFYNAITQVQKHHLD